MNNYVWVFIGLFVAFSALFVGAYFYEQHQAANDPLNTYHGFEFTEAPSGSDTLWVTQVAIRGQLYNIPFYYHPTEVLDVEFQEGLAEAILTARAPPDIVYITLDPDAGSRPVVAGVEISRIFGKRYNMLNYEVDAALTRPAEGVETPIITCDDATDGVLVVLFEQTGFNRVYNEGNCVLVQYVDPEDSIRVADRFAYELLGII